VAGRAALLLSLLLAPSTAAIAAPRRAPAGAIRYVIPTGSDASTDCSLPAPCQTVQRAVGVAKAGDEIHVAAGTYAGSMSDSSIDQGVTATVIVSKALAALSGGYSADFTVQAPQTYPTVLSASGSPGAFVLYLNGTSARVDGFTLTGATGACSPGCGSHYEGGAVRIRGGTPTLRNNRIENNFAFQRGAGIYVADGAVATIDSNWIVSNTVDGSGGGLYLQGANAFITNNQILSNTAAFEGAGIYVDANVPAVISHNAIGYNTATNPFSAGGGGVRTLGGQALVTISHNDIFSNSIYGGGGGLNIGGPALVDGNAVHGNTLRDDPHGVRGWGGALLVASLQPVTVTNNLVYDNGGSGVQVVDSVQAAFVNNTVAGNFQIQPDSGTEADAFLIWFDTFATGPIQMTVFNNILADNANCGLFFHNPNNLAGITSAHNDSWNNHAGAANYCESASPGPGDISANPLFANAAAGDYHLLAGSPALDIGTSTQAPVHDKDCHARPLGAGFDLGAYERSAATARPSLDLNFRAYLPLLHVSPLAAC